METAQSFAPLICPLCASPLSREGSALFCGGPRRHCYDVAAAGYVNLLPPGKKNNAAAGDDADMLRARSAFLAGGWYDPISDTAARLGAEVLGTRDATFVDAGCGEGYHTCRIARALGGTAIGIDAAKRGAAAGAKLARRWNLTGVRFAAGNIFALPVADHSCDLVYSIFAPIPGEEAARILKESGALIVAGAGPRHLWELRQKLYGEPRVGAVAKAPEGFHTVHEETLSYHISLPDRETVAALFAMTPFYYRSPKAGREQLLACDGLTVQVEVVFRILEQL